MTVADVVRRRIDRALSGFGWQLRYAEPDAGSLFRLGQFTREERDPASFLEAEWLRDRHDRARWWRVVDFSLVKAHREPEPNRLHEQ